MTEPSRPGAEGRKKAAFNGAAHAIHEQFW